jgi:GDPmannose 4,6-dehydratase
MKSAIIFGVTGQDGSYLSEILLNRGYTVHGVVRRSSSFNTKRIEHLIDHGHPGNRSQNNLQLHYGDLVDSLGTTEIIRTLRPDLVFNLAAQSHVKISFDIPIYTHQVNFLGVQNILEGIRLCGSEIRFYQASTSELYGNQPAPQRLETLFAPESPYGISKQSAHSLVDFYHKTYGLFAVAGILFNHESYRRGENFVTKKIIKEGVRIKTQLKKNVKPEKIRLGNIRSRRDWGYAPEYMYAAYEMLLADSPNSIVVGTGISASVHDFLNRTFKNLDLDPDEWLQNDSLYERLSDVVDLQADNASMSSVLGWTPKTDWKKLCDLMCEQELSASEKLHDWSNFDPRSNSLGFIE